MSPGDAPYCWRCLFHLRGKRLVSPYADREQIAELHCGLCMRIKPPFVKAVAYGSYDGELRELIQLLKYQHVRPAATVLGKMLSEAVDKLEFAADTGHMLVIPVPLHRRKLRERGFTHCQLIAEAALQLQPGRRLSIDASVLKRRRGTQSQTGLTRHQRRENVRGASLVERPA